MANQTVKLENKTKQNQRQNMQCSNYKTSTKLKTEFTSIIPDYKSLLDHANATSCNEIESAFLNVGFENITYNVTKGIFNRENKTLLNNVSGNFLAGKLTAIMGPSGAGKSTLMNILAGYTTGASGELLINNDPRFEPNFRKQSCYIMQNDQLQPLLTVLEAMNIAVELKISNKLGRKEKQEKVKDILDSLGLWNIRKVRTQSLSGGQRKRLSIALELLKNPQIMFFDEPTSGLDSLTSKQCILLLKQLALTGRTIICTIHQPSATIFEMFDHLYVLAKGHCIYDGIVGNLLPYLKDINLICPPYHNPADFLLEVAAGDLGDHFNDLLKKKAESDDFRSFSNGEHSIDGIHTIKSIENNKKSCCDGIFQCFRSEYPTSFINQLLILSKRNYLVLSRDMTLTYSRIITHLIIALFIGFLYHGIGTEAQNMLNNFNYLFFSVMFLMFTAFNSVSTTFPSELPLISKEHFNKWYSLKAYYLAITISDVPIQIFATLLYAVITYFLTEQPRDETYRILFFLFMCVLVSLVAQSFGLFIGASMDVKNGVIFGPFCFLPFTIFSGFFVQLHAAHPYFRWVFHISFLKYGLEGVVLSVMGYDRGKLPCEADYCHYSYPKKFLESMDMDQADYWFAVSFMIVLITIIRLAAFFALKFQIKLRR